MSASVVVFGIGNRSRGDDAVGPQLLDRLEGWLGARGLAVRFELLEAYQLQVENALDLEGRELALFIDALRDAPAAAVLRRLDPAVTALSSDSHRLEPSAVLEVHRRVTGRPPPPAFALGIRAERFGLGEGLSEASQKALDEAWPLLESLAGDPRLASWQALASTSRAQEEIPMATRKIPAATKAGGGKAAAAPKAGAKRTAKKQAVAAPPVKVPAGKVPAAKPEAKKVPASRPRKAAPKMPGPSEPDRILMVAEAAYYRAEQRGFAAGSELEDWLAAEEEIARHLAGR